VTHGIALSLLAIWFLGRYQRRPRRSILVMIGLTVGLLFLTKAEIFLAGGLAVTAGLALTWRLRPPPPGRRFVSVGAFVGGAMLAPSICLAVFTARMPFAEAWNGVLGTWPAIFSGEVGRLRLYR